ncbi:MAG: aquaporin family protein [Mycoplasma sp.]|nr:aquaporin family protein [Mycoplasma sp.]
MQFVMETSLWMNIVGEFLGTFLLVFLGNGSCFSVNHRKMFANQPGKWIIVVFGWAAAAFIALFVSLSLGAPGNLNPAVSIYFSFKDPIFLIYIVPQLMGAIIAQTFLYIMNYYFIKVELNSIDGNNEATRASSCTNPVYNNNEALLGNLLYEFMGTSVLMLVVFIFNNFVILNQGNVIDITIVSISIISIGISVGSATGFAINPARDLGPRIVYQILLFTKYGKGLVNANWQYSWVPVVGSILAGVLFGLISLAL